MYSNSNTLLDSYGESSDWIELYNPSANNINLENYALTDDVNKSSYWKFPAISIAPYSYMVVFASGRATQNGSEIHTDFKLKRISEELTLLNPQGKIISAYPIRCAPRDKTLGYKPDGGSTLFVLEPTPGMSNNVAKTTEINHTNATLTFSKEAGLYESEFELELHTDKDNTVVYYTTNGDEPNENSNLYTTAIPIIDRTLEESVISKIRTSDSWQKPQNEFIKNTPIRAVAYSYGCPASEIITKSYFVQKNIKSKYHVPIVSLVTEADNLFDNEIGIYVEGNHNNFYNRGSKWEREAHFEYFKADTLSYTQNIGIRIHGGYSRQKAQKSLRLISDKKYGSESFNYPFFDEKPFVTNPEKLILRTVRDWSHSYIKDPLTHDLVKNLNMYNMASQLVVVFINGEYWGIHSIREYQDVPYIQKNFGTSDSLFDIVTHARGKDVTLVSGSKNSYHEFVDYLNNNNLALDEVYEEVSKKIDIKNLIDYYISEIYFANMDFPDNNLKLWKSTQSDTAKWRYFYYDCDECMSRAHLNAFDLYTNELPAHQLYSDYITLVFSELIKNESFRRSFSQRYFYLLQTAFNPVYVSQRIDYFEKLYSPLVAEHTLRWRFFEDPIVWQNSVDMLRKFAWERPLVVAQQLQENFEPPFIAYPTVSNRETGIYISANSTMEECENIKIELVSIQGKTVQEWQTTTCKLNEFHANTQFLNGTFVLKIHYNNAVFNSQIIIN